VGTRTDRVASNYGLMITGGYRQAMADVNLLLVQDPMDASAAGLRQALQSLGGWVRTATAGTAAEGLERALSGGFDGILLDDRLPDRDGLELLALLRQQLGPEVSLVQLVSGDDELAAVHALRAGADDYLPKSRMTPAALERVLHRSFARRGAENGRPEAAGGPGSEAAIDPATGLPGATRFRRELEMAVTAAQRRGQPLVLLALGLAGLQRVLDTGGAEAGQAAMAELGLRLRSQVRVVDTFFRTGEDRFMAILESGSDREAAALRLKELVRRPIPFGPGVLELDLSVGAAEYPADGHHPETLLQAAEGALEWARGSGGEPRD
jgi:diguanylate cyclase (GGDEF)-like protein